MLPAMLYVHNFYTGTILLMSVLQHNEESNLSKENDQVGDLCDGSAKGTADLFRFGTTQTPPVK